MCSGGRTHLPEVDVVCPLAEQLVDQLGGLLPLGAVLRDGDGGGGGGGGGRGVAMGGGGAGGQNTKTA